MTEEKTNNSAIKDQSALAALCLCLSSIPLGWAFLQPDTAAMAWLGMLLMALGLCFEAKRAWLIGGLIAGGCISHWLGHPWYLESVVRWSSGLWPIWQVALLWFSSTLFAVVLPERLFILLWVCLPRAFQSKIPIFCWLPLAWWLGEKLVFWSFHLCQHLLFYSQWQVQPILRAIGHFGWTPVLFYTLALCAGLAQTLFQRQFKWALLPLGGALLLLLLPALPQNKDKLAGMGAVYLQTYFDLPNSAPPEIEILVWPEVAFSRRPRVTEGLNQQIQLAPPFASDNTWHLVGYKTLSQAGLQNAVLALDPRGKVWGMRAKHLLFPGWERPVMGFSAPRAEYFIPGKQLPLMQVAGRKVAPLLCLEEFDRALAQSGKDAGAEILAILAIDYGMTQSELGYQQFVGISVLLAVDMGLPLVRSSLGGPAAFIDSDGSVLADSHYGETGILVYSGAENE